MGEAVVHFVHAKAPSGDGIPLILGHGWPSCHAELLPLVPAEVAYLGQARRWDETERGYTAIQSTKPQTLGYGLNDSPAGLAAWILEKWRSWSDCGGRLESAFSRDFLLTIVTVYWVTATITSSMRDYHDNRRWQGEPRLGPGDRTRVPAAAAVKAGAA